MKRMYHWIADMQFHAKPISFKPPRLSGLSARLLASHYESNYGGAVRRLNAIRAELAMLNVAGAPGFMLNGLKREELIATNSMLLHEVYFDGLAGPIEGGGGEPEGELAGAIEHDFGSFARWRAEFVAMGKALGGGSGWVVLTRSPRDDSLSNVWSANHTHALAGGVPVLALDMYEHSYHLDFGANPAAYVDAFMNNLHWPRIGQRYASTPSAPRPYAIDAPTARRLIDSDPNIVVVDARLADDALAVPVRLPRAKRAPPDRVKDFVAMLKPGTKALVYCAWGFEIGGDCAAKLRERGIDAVTIAGGIGAWRADGLPTEPLNEGDAS
jgi:Fe-Mn family superoxide dismutase